MAMAIPIAMAAMTAVSAISQASQASNAAKYNAQVAEQNAQIARQQGAAAAEAQARQAKQQLGKMQANYAASGVDVGQGSPLDVLADSAAQAELDNLNTRYNYDLRARGFDNTSNLERSNASNAMSSGYLNAAGGALKAYSGAGGSFGGGSMGGGTPIPLYNTLAQS